MSPSELDETGRTVTSVGKAAQPEEKRAARARRRIDCDGEPEASQNGAQRRGARGPAQDPLSLPLNARPL
jgi:hypothetical protein